MKLISCKIWASLVNQVADQQLQYMNIDKLFLTCHNHWPFQQLSIQNSNQQLLPTTLINNSNQKLYAITPTNALTSSSNPGQHLLPITLTKSDPQLQTRTPTNSSNLQRQPMSVSKNSHQQLPIALTINTYNSHNLNIMYTVDLPRIKRPLSIPGFHSTFLWKVLSVLIFRQAQLCARTFGVGMWKRLTASVLEDGIATSICTTKWKWKRKRKRWGWKRKRKRFFFNRFRIPGQKPS